MPRDPYLTPYRRSHEQHGTDFNVTLWANPQTQRARFDAFTQMCFLSGKRVLDAGCSRGDFAAYMIERHIAYSRYIGVDGLQQVIEFADTRGLPNAEFHCGDLVHDANLMTIGDPQVICISGTLNTMSDEHVNQVLTAAWRATRQTLIFNFLSDRHGPGVRASDAPARDDPLLPTPTTKRRALGQTGASSKDLPDLRLHRGSAGRRCSAAILLRWPSNRI